MIKKGDKFICIKTVIMDECHLNGEDDIAYIQGKIYKSDIGGAITDEDGDKRHTWIDYQDEFTKYFIRMQCVQSKLFQYVNQ